jgi:fumarate reductase subunit C
LHPAVFIGRNRISFKSYIKQLSVFVLSSSFSLGLILGIVALVVGETTVSGNLDFGFGALDGFWIILGLPVLSMLVFVLLSPLSFFIHKLLSKRGDQRAAPDA